MQIYKQRRTRPYLANGKTAFNIQNRPGVYLVYQGEKIVYIGYSGTNLYKTMYRHFQSWKDKNQIRVTYNKNDERLTVRVVYTANKSQAQKLEKALIVKYTPRDNPLQYETHELSNADEQKIKTYLDADIKNIVRFEGDLPF